VDDSEKLAADARTLSLSEFVTQYRGCYLAKPPLAETIGRSQNEPERRGFDTERFSRSTLKALQSSADQRAALLGDWAPRWVVLPVRKRVETFPDRISIGRTSASDIRIDFGFVSKLHAHIYLNPNGTIDIIDRSANGMRLDRRDLTKGERQRLYIGCRLELGPLELDLLDATSLHQVLASR